MALILTEKQHLLDNVWAFRFKAEPPFSWIAGQFVYVELPHENPDKEGAKRWFTVSSAPFEGIVQITTRVTDSTFKQALAKLEPGDTSLQLIDPPSGDFIWQDSDLPLVFVAGGIGITPFRSILKQRHYDNLPLNVSVVYSSRTNDIPFKDELDQWAADDPHLHVHYLVGEPLAAARLHELLPSLNESLVYVSGPEPMVESVGDQLRDQGLPDTQLKQDFFPNYDKNNY